jgi:hypothetical protein
MTAPSDTDIKVRLAEIAETAIGITVLPYTLFCDMPGVDISALGLLQGDRLHYGYISRGPNPRVHVEKSHGPHGTTTRTTLYRINIIRGIEVDGTGEAEVSANIEDLADYFERFDDQSEQIFPSTTYPGTTILAGEGSFREDQQEIQRSTDGRIINYAYYQLAVRVRVRRGT